MDTHRVVLKPLCWYLVLELRAAVVLTDEPLPLRLRAFWSVFSPKKSLYWCCIFPSSLPLPTAKPVFMMHTSFLSFSFLIPFFYLSFKNLQNTVSLRGVVCRFWKGENEFATQRNVERVKHCEYFRMHCIYDKTTASAHLAVTRRREEAHNAEGPQQVNVLTCPLVMWPLRVRPD